MPTFEFFGYDRTEADTLTGTVRQRLSNLPFKQDIVFVSRSEDSKVTGWDGEPQPFIRILTRSQDKAIQMRGLIADLSDIETVIIDFQKRGSN